MAVQQMHFILHLLQKMAQGLQEPMTNAMREAKVTPEQIDYINAHGTSTHHNDLFETRAIHLALKDSAVKVPVSSTKSMIGHMLGAAGACGIHRKCKDDQRGIYSSKCRITGN